MLWNRRFLFLHYPKTAGISLTEAFVAAWEPPVFGIVAAGQLQTMRHRNDELVFLTNGSGHESLARAHHILSADGGRCFGCLRAYRSGRWSCPQTRCAMRTALR